MLLLVGCSGAEEPDSNASSSAPDARVESSAAASADDPDRQADHSLLRKLRSIEVESDVEARAGLARALVPILREEVAGASVSDRLPWVRAFDSLAEHRGSSVGAWLDTRQFYELLDHSVYRAAGAPDSPLAPFLTYHALRLNVASGRYAEPILSLLDALSRPDLGRDPFVPWAAALASERSRLRGDFDDASRWIAQARRALDTESRVNQSAHHQHGRALTELHTAKLHLDLGRKRKALECLGLADALIESMAQPSGAVEPLAGRKWRGLAADAYQLRLATLSAMGLYRAVIREANTPPPMDLGDHVEARVQYELGFVLARIGENEAADEALASCLGARGLDGFTRILALLERAHLALDRDDRDAFSNCLDQAEVQLAERPGLTLPAARLSGLKALGLPTATEVDRRARRRALQDAFDLQLDAWNRTVDGEGGVGFLDFGPRRFLFEQLLTESLTRSDHASAIRTVGEAEARGNLARRLGARGATLGEIQRRLLVGDEGVLVFVPSWRGIHAFAIDRTSVSHHRLPSLEDLQPMIAGATTAFRRPGGTSDASELLSLSREVLPQELCHRIHGWSAITLVGAEHFGGVPPTAWLVRSTDGADPVPLGLFRPLAELPSLTVGLALVDARKNARSAPGSTRVVLATEPSEEVVQSRSLDRIEFPEGARHGLAGCQVFEGDQGGASALADPPATIVVFAHGVADPLRNSPTGLVLAPDSIAPQGVVFAEQLASIWPDQDGPDLLFVAACHAGRAHVRLGDDESDTLFAALAEAGGRCAIVSRETLYQAATARLIGAYLEAVRPSPASAADRSPAEALLVARRQLARHTKFSAPRYWAPLTALGLAHRRDVGR